MTATLIGTLPDLAHSFRNFTRITVQKRDKAFPRLGYWARQIHVDQVSENGAEFRLPFQAFNPNYQLQLGNLGLVHVKLVVPGQGVWEATAENVPLRSNSVIRNRRAQIRGSGFFPEETTSPISK